MAQFIFSDFGVQDYKKCWDCQEEFHAKILADKRLKGEPSSENCFILVEHPHVYTSGKSGNQANILISDDFMGKIGASFIKTNRGGDITYHGPGQIVGYPIVDLEFYHLGVREFIEKMEKAIIETLAEFGVAGTRRSGATGVWIDAINIKKARKICAIGVRVSRFVTMHGFALNVNTDLRYFSYINPCGFESSAVTSMQNELGYTVNEEKVKSMLKEKFNLVY